MWRARFDARGNKIEGAYFGPDGGPCPHALGVATFTAKYDDRGNEIEHVNLGMDGKPVLQKKQRYATWRAKYDQRGNKIEQAYFGVDGQPCMHKDGFAGYSEERDELGNLVKRVYVDVHGKTVRVVGSPAMMNEKGVVAVDTESDSLSAQEGIQRGDILLEYGDWRFFPLRNFYRSMGFLRLAMAQNEQRRKRLVLFCNGSSSVVEYDFGPGPIGLEILDSLWTGEDLKGIQEAYEKFFQERGATKQKEE